MKSALSSEYLKYSSWTGKSLARGSIQFNWSFVGIPRSGLSFDTSAAWITFFKLQTIETSSMKRSPRSIDCLPRDTIHLVSPPLTLLFQYIYQDICPPTLICVLAPTFHHNARLPVIMKLLHLLSLSAFLFTLVQSMTISDFPQCTLCMTFCIVFFTCCSTLTYTASIHLSQCESCRR